MSDLRDKGCRHATAFDLWNLVNPAKSLLAWLGKAMPSRPLSARSMARDIEKTERKRKRERERERNTIAEKRKHVFV